MELQMLEQGYLFRGLDALSRAHETNYFTDGHRGAAIIAAYYLCQEVDVEAGVADIIRAMIDEHWTYTDLCAPFPDETPKPAQIDRIVHSMEQNVVGLRQAGHNVILPALALKALRQLPQAVTPSRVAGVCKLVEAFTIVADIALQDGDDIPDLGTLSAPAEFILSELLSAMEAFDNRGQGWSGHLLTYSRALYDLRQLGYDALAGKGAQAFKLYIKRIRMGPLETDKPRPEHPPSNLYPHQRAYWEARRDRPVGIGHVFKYPYGFYKWMDLCRDPELKGRCMQAAYHVL
jgi:hypothetical protein